MSNNYYTHGSFPSTGAQATSASMRSELDLITAGFDKLPTLTSNANKFVVVNSLGTALIVTSTLPAATVTDSDFTVQDNADTTKKFQFQASGITTGTTRTYTMPDANTTLVGTDATQPLTNKTTFSATGAITLNTTTNAQSYTTTGAGTITISSGTTGTINNMSIGATTAAAGTFTSLSDSGNLTFTGTGNRITGDTNNATISSRLFFQSNTTNGSTTFGVLPNGTSLISGYQAYNNSDPTNAAFIQIATSAGTEARVTSGITGTGTYLPMTFYTGGSERMRVDTSGRFGINVTPSTATTAQLQVTGGNTNASTLATAYSTATVALVPKSSSGYSLAVASGSGDFPLLQVSAAGAASGDLLIQPYGGSVGIGTSTPSTYGAKLAVYSAASSVANIQITNPGVGTGTIGIAAASSNFKIYNSFASATLASGAGIDIDSSGNVGIGNTSPSALLYVQSANTNALVINEILRNPNTGSGIAAIGFNVSSVGEGDYTQAGIGLLRSVANGSGSLCFYNKGSGSASNFTTADEKMRIDTSGNVQIGTTTADGQVHIKAATGQSVPLTLTTTDATANTQIVFKGSRNFQIGTGNASSGFAGSLFFYDGTAAATRMSIDSAGSLNLSGSYTEGVVAIGNSGTAQTLSLASGTVQTVTMTGNCTFTMPTATAGKSFILIVNSGAGSFTGTFTSVKWPNNAAPTLTTTASRWDILTFVSNGSAWYGNFAQAYA